MPTGTELLTVREVAQQLRRGERTVWRWVSTGELPSVKVGAARLVTADALRSFLRRAEKRGRVI